MARAATSYIVILLLACSLKVSLTLYVPHPSVGAVDLAVRQPQGTTLWHAACDE
jgi:hypothetical protein